MINSPRPLGFGSAYPQPQRTGMYNVIIGNGDGSSSALTFRNKAEADSFATQAFEGGHVEFQPDVEELAVYETAQQAMEHLDYLA